jgi:hypothetical protein
VVVATCTAYLDSEATVAKARKYTALELNGSPMLHRFLSSKPTKQMVCHLLFLFVPVQVWDFRGGLHEATVALLQATFPFAIEWRATMSAYTMKLWLLLLELNDIRETACGGSALLIPDRSGAVTESSKSQ